MYVNFEQNKFAVEKGLDLLSIYLCPGLCF